MMMIKFRQHSTLFRAATSASFQLIPVLNNSGQSKRERRGTAFPTADFQSVAYNSPTKIKIAYAVIVTRRRRFVGHILRLPATRPARLALQRGLQKTAGDVEDQRTWQDSRYAEGRFGRDGCGLE